MIKSKVQKNNSDKLNLGFLSRSLAQIGLPHSNLPCMST